MGPEIIAAIVGPIVGAIVGTGAFVSRRNITRTDTQLQKISQDIEVISHQITSVQVSLPTNYVTKQDFANHVESEERFQSEINIRLIELREELITLRVQSHRG